MSCWRSKTALAVLAGAGLGALGAAALGAAVRWWRGRRATPREAALQERPTRETGADRRLRLYHSFPFRSSRCAWLVNELGAADYVELVAVDLHGSEAEDLLRYREVHPHGTLPALVLEDDSAVLESAAICLYLAEVFLDPEGSNLLPEPEHTAEYYKSVASCAIMPCPLYTIAKSIVSLLRVHMYIYIRVYSCMFGYLDAVWSSSWQHQLARN